jgi:hypothetical protein
MYYIKPNKKVMKKLILSELLLLFLATTFISDNPPGWVQQSISLGSRVVTDIYFLDSLNGYSVTNGGSSGLDSSLIFRTTNGGNNWVEQFRFLASFSSVQFVDNNTGYVTGGTGFGRLWKTTNAGINWDIINTAGHFFEDLYFINRDTGWISDEDISGAGLRKTTNGGINWSQQLSGSFRPTKLFFIDKDTGWVACQNVNLYRTTNGGSVWILQHTFAQTIGDIGFLNRDFGIVTSGVNQRTTDGGFTWIASQNSITGLKLNITSDSIAWAGLNFIYVVKTTTGGRNWFYQSSPINNNQTISALDSLIAWAGGSGVVHTTDGGGPPVGINPLSNEIPLSYNLYQNYPNPFNPSTKIKYQITNSKEQIPNVKLSVFDLQGKLVQTLIDENQRAGIYETEFDGGAFSSGIYFYSLIIDGKPIETRKMILLK